MPHDRYRSGLVSARANPLRPVLACRSPPTSSKVTVDRIFVSTRPVRSPNFSPSLAKTSSRRRWSAHSWSFRSGSAISSDRGAAWRRAAAGLVEDSLLHEDRHLRADRQGDRVRRARVELELWPAGIEIDDRVEDVVAQVGDHDARERHLEPTEERQEQIVGEGPGWRHALKRDGDPGRLGQPDGKRHGALFAL